MSTSEDEDRIRTSGIKRVRIGSLCWYAVELQAARVPM